MNLYRNLSPLGLHSANQEYIGPIKYHIVLASCSLGLIPY